MKNTIFLVIFQLIVCLLYSGTANAGKYVLLIGGGPSLDSSQSSIEQNVIWSEQIIKGKNPGATIRIFYSDGDNPAPDIVNHLQITDPDAGLLPFDRVFTKEAAIKEYYNHSINRHSGTTAPEHMKPIVINDFKNLTNNDSVLVLFNGHGGYAPQDLSNNYLRLWGEKKLTVYDFESMLSEIKSDIPVRFIMTQCFSGGFTNAIHHNAKTATFELAGNRCGFMSQSARKESEGCTASLDIGDYRDYSTYFFAALDGKTRQNTPLANNPDIDGSTSVSLREAHLYTLATAYSSDISRSTSEDYLEKWEPWYLRWISDKNRPKKSIYYKTAIKLASNNKITLDSLNNPHELRNMRLYLKKEYEKLAKKDRGLKKAIKVIQRNIQKELSKSFPDLKSSYKNRFSNYSNKDIERAKNTILKTKEYPRLKQLFQDRDILVMPLIDANRKLTQVVKLFRLSKLAKLDVNMPIFSNKTIYNNYNKLLACENTDL